MPCTHGEEFNSPPVSAPLRRRTAVANPQIGIIGIPGKWSTEAIADAIEARTGFRLIIDMGQVSLNLDEGALYYRATNLCALDGLIINKIDANHNQHTQSKLELLRVAEAAGVRVFSSPEQSLRLINRLSCTLTLRNGNIPMPPTTITEDISAACAAVQRYNSAIFTPIYPAKAQGTKLMQSLWGDLRLTQSIKHYQAIHPLMYIQQQLQLSNSGIKVVFLNGEYRCSYTKASDGGGPYLPHTPSPAIINIAQQAQALFKLDFASVDIAESTRGPVVFDVSAFGGLRGALEGGGLHAAAYAEHIVNQL